MKDFKVATFNKQKRCSWLNTSTERPQFNSGLSVLFLMVQKFITQDHSEDSLECDTPRDNFWDLGTFGGLEWTRKVMNLEEWENVI